MDRLLLDPDFDDNMDVALTALALKHDAMINVMDEDGWQLNVALEHTYSPPLPKMLTLIAGQLARHLSWCRTRERHYPHAQRSTRSTRRMSRKKWGSEHDMINETRLGLLRSNPWHMILVLYNAEVNRFRFDSEAASTNVIVRLPEHSPLSQARLSEP